MADENTTAATEATASLDALTDVQRAAVQTYSAVAASQSQADAIRALSVVNWDVQEAVERYLSGDTSAPRGAPSSSAAAGEAPRDAGVSRAVRVTPPRRTHWLLAALLSPLRMLWAMVRRVNALIWRAFGGHARALADASGRPWERFRAVYEAQHGTVHPPFFEGGLLDAVAAAQTNAQFVVVYLHAESHAATAGFCRRVMSDDVFVAAATVPDVVLWAGDVAQRDGAAAQTALRAAGFPYLALVQPPSRSVRSTGALPPLSSAHFGRVLASRAGPHAASMTGTGAASWLEAAVAANRVLLERVREVRESRERDRRLIAEQNAEFQESLRADRERERLAREERLRAEDETRRVEERETRRRRKKEGLGEEPDKGPGICSVVLRLPNGTRVQRRFDRDDLLERVFDWAEVNLVDIEVACLVTTYPRKRFRYPEDAGTSLVDGGLFPSAMLLLEERAEDE